MGKPIPDIVVRGIRAPIPSGYLLGRQSSGTGAVELIPVASLLKGQGVSGSGGSGASTLATLTDVSVTEGAGINGYVLYWDNATGFWKAQALTDTDTLATLTDVNVAEGAGIDGYFLYWNNATSQWKAKAIAMSTLTDVVITSVATGQILKWNGSDWVNVDNVSALVFAFDGSGAAPPANSICDLNVPFNCTIVSATTLSDVTGSCVLDVWVANFSTSSPPTVANTITASALPTLSSATGAQDSTLTGWSKNITAGQSVRVNVNSASTLTKITLILKVKKTS